jgi:polysaccharide export outer membrane protein
MKLFTGIFAAVLGGLSAGLAEAPLTAATNPRLMDTARRSAADANLFPDNSTEPAAPKNSAPPVVRRPPAADYRLSPGDSVRLSVFNEPKLEDEGTLSNSGEVSFPLIGAVRLSGKTLNEAEKIIEELYEKDYLVDARVTLSLTALAHRAVTVSGAVAMPGAVLMPPDGPFDVLAAISAAGGVTEKANLRGVTLRPAAGGASIPCDLAAMQANPALARQLKPGDTLTIAFIAPRVAKWVNVMGEVKSPAPVEVPEGGRIDVLTAIASAGGYSRIANPKKVTVVRPGAGGKQSFPLNAAAMAEGAVPLFYLLPGDTLTVGESRF